MRSTLTGMPRRHRSLNEPGYTLIDRIALPKEVCESRQTGYRHCPSISDAAPLHWIGEAPAGIDWNRFASVRI